MFVVVAVLVISCLALAGPDKQNPLYEKYQTLSRIVAAVSANYVEKVDTDKLFYGAYEGMLGTLDPYSAFLPPEEKEDLEVETKGEFGGLGVEITTDKNGVLTVITPLEDSPAFKSGVLAGDRIIKIEGKSTKGLALPDAIKKLRGPKGKPVTITVLHEDGKIADITIIRDMIKLESIKDAHFVDEKHKIAYLRMTQFQANTAASLDEAVKKLRDQGMKGLVIDLRYNPGGLLTSAIEIADRFLAEGIIVSTKGRASREQVFRAGKQGTYPDFAVAFLISGRSASAAEILAGAVQDNKRGLLVGSRTFGKASVQSLIQLEDGKSALRLTTAHYYTPSGRLIHHNPNDANQKEWGIDPDIEIKSTLQDEIDLWENWRKEATKKVEELKKKNGKEDATDEKTPPKKDEAPPKKEAPAPAPAPDPDDEIVPPDDVQPEKDKDKDKDAKQPKEFHDKPLEAAVNALKGVLIMQERVRAAGAK